MATANKNSESERNELNLGKQRGSVSHKLMVKSQNQNHFRKKADLNAKEAEEFFEEA